MSRQADAFAFKPELTPQANVEAFLEHLEEQDKEFAALLRDNLRALLGAAERERTEARKRFNQSIAKSLDVPPHGQEGAPS